LLVVADQLIAEFVVPRLERLAGRVVSRDAAGPHDEERIGLAGFAAALVQVIANRPQGGVKRIARTERPAEILFLQD